MLLEGQLRVADIVDIGAVVGEVEETTVRYVCLRKLNGDAVFVPNGIISNVVNKASNFSMAIIDIGVAYRENIDEVLEVMKEVARTLTEDAGWIDKTLGEPEIFGVEDLGDSSVIIRVRLKVLPGEQWAVRRDYLRRIKRRFDELGIDIPYPHLTVYAGQGKDENPLVFRIDADEKNQ